MHPFVLARTLTDCSNSRWQWTYRRVETNLECKNRRLHNPSDGKITSLVEIDRLKKHICIGARNDISMNANNEDASCKCQMLSNTLGGSAGITSELT